MRLDEDPLAVAWFPESMRGHVVQRVAEGDTAAALAELRDNWRYVLVEEVAGGVAELHSWPWPLVDQTGRLIWPDSGADVETEAVPSDELQQRVYAPDLMRQPRAGDTFAVRQPARAAHQSGDDPVQALLGGQILDISPDARHAAKVSYYSSSSAILREDAAVTDLLQEAARQRDQQAATALVMEESPPPGQNSTEQRN